MQHAAEALEEAAFTVPFEVLLKPLGGGASAQDRGKRLGAFGGAQPPEGLSLFVKVGFCHVHLHVEGAHGKPLGCSRVVRRQIVAAQNLRGPGQPGQLLPARVPEVLVGVKDLRRRIRGEDWLRRKRGEAAHL